MLLRRECFRLERFLYGMRWVALVVAAVMPVAQPHAVHGVPQVRFQAVFS